MSSDDTAISVRDVSKHYLLFAKPEDRLKQSIMPRLQRLVRRQPKQYYRDFAALHRVSFDVKRGDTVGIIGRNGCGKSTLLQIVCGILQPSSGTVSVNGRIAALLELGSGFNRDFSGRENVYMNGAILGLSRAEISARFEAIARFADIGDFLEQPVKTYSSGMQVRLAFATAINVDPDILVVDEALAVGDEAFKRKCYARLEEIQNKGGTILFVSHSAQAIVQLCSRAMLIDGGELLLLGAPKTVVSQYQRLIALKPEEQAVARAALRTAPLGGKVTEAGESTGEPAAPIAPIKELEDPDFLDPNMVDMVGASRVEYPVRGAQISNIRIENKNGKVVNNIHFGNDYFYCYDVLFLEDVENAGFGLAMRGVSGLHLFGQSSCEIGKGSRYRADEKVRVRFPFRNLLSPGAYFCNAGVGKLENGETHFMHRLLDAFMFRVSPIGADILCSSAISLRNGDTIVERA